MSNVQPEAKIAELESYLHKQIPLSAAIGMKIETIAPDRLVLSAPLEPNLNHKATAFGGSIATLAILSGWGFVHQRLKDAGIDAELVIRRSETVYLTAVRSRFFAQASLFGDDEWMKFERAAQRRRMARIEVQSVITCEGEACARFSGEFVAVPK